LMMAACSKFRLKNASEARICMLLRSCQTGKVKIHKYKLILIQQLEECKNDRVESYMLLCRQSYLINDQQTINTGE
jgi:hypothetical protein